MDKLSGVEREAKAIVEHLKKHCIVVCDGIVHFLPFTSEEMLQKHIEEAIYEFAKLPKKVK